MIESDERPERDSSPALPTCVRAERARSIISHNQSPDVPFSASINPYRGCEHGCIYCYARPTHAYLDLSPGLDFETRISAKDNAPELFARALRKPGYRANPIAIGGNTDPYQPVERERRITRRLLEVALDARHPVALVTKSTLVVRDLDLLAEMARRQLIHVFVSVTSLSTRLSNVLEPRAASPAARLATIAELSAAGVPVGAMVAPVIPHINDAELERVVASTADAGALAVRYILLRLPLEVAVLFDAWLEQHFPERRQRVLAAIREMRGGALDDPRFGVRMRGLGPYAQLLSRRFEVAAQRRGLEGELPALCESDFRPPPASDGQLGLFGG